MGFVIPFRPARPIGNPRIVRCYLRVTGFVVASGAKASVMPRISSPVRRTNRARHLEQEANRSSSGAPVLVAGVVAQCWIISSSSSVAANSAASTAYTTHTATSIGRPLQSSDASSSAVRPTCRHPFRALRSHRRGFPCGVVAQERGRRTPIRPQLVPLKAAVAVRFADGHDWLLPTLRSTVARVVEIEPSCAPSHSRRSRAHFSSL